MDIYNQEPQPERLETCPDCNGRGERYDEWFEEIRVCKRCEGTGKVESDDFVEFKND